MQLTYKFHHLWHPQLAEWCQVSKNLYNQALYLVKKSLREDQKWLFYRDLDKLMKITPNLENKCNYKSLKAQCSQQILKLLEKDIKSYINGIKD